MLMTQVKPITLGLDGTSQMSQIKLDAPLEAIEVSSKKTGSYRFAPLLAYFNIALT